MPIQTLSSVSEANDIDAVKGQLLAKIEQESLKRRQIAADVDADFDDDFESVEEAAENERILSLEEFQRFADATKEIKLERLIQVKQPKQSVFLCYLESTFLSFDEASFRRVELLIFVIVKN